MFKGFKFDDPAFQAKTDSFGFNDEVVFAILQQYEDCIQPLVLGMVFPSNTQRVGELADLMGFAASTGHYVGVAMSCFCNQGGVFLGKLPIPIDEMDKDVKEYLIDLYNAYAGPAGFSESGMKYFADNESKVLELAELGDVQMQCLVGKYINRLDLQPKNIIYRNLLEKSALSGYDIAYYDAGCAFDGNEDDPNVDLEKAAYWFHKGGMIENRNSMPSLFNMGLMYARGDFVEKDLETASFYLSLVYRNAHKTPQPDYEKFALDYMQENSIEQQSPPYVLGDKELDPETAEFSNVYSR